MEKKRMNIQEDIPINNEAKILLSVIARFLESKPHTDLPLTPHFVLGLSDRVSDCETRDVIALAHYDMSYTTDDIGVVTTSDGSSSSRFPDSMIVKQHVRYINNGEPPTEDVVCEALEGFILECMNNGIKS